MKYYKYLKDASFLKKIDNLQVREQYVKITVLDFYERPIEEIQGKVTSGTISLNGSSAIRRTCNLTMVATEYDNGYENADNLISINKKAQIEIGIKNTLRNYVSHYGDVIWFPLGVYVITSKSISHSLEGVTITLSLKDKMCLLNGECGGTLPAAINFKEVEVMTSDGSFINQYPTIYQIIQELVSHYGGEQLGKIIISDLDLKAKQIKKWNGENPLYIVENTVDGKISYTLTTTKPTDGIYTKYDKGSNVGYEYVDFIYPGELTSNIGESVVSVLDKIKNTLGNFEYYYDIYGNFIFQEIKDYLNTSKAAIDLNNMNKENYSIDISNGKSVYVFDTSNLISSYSNAPKYNMIKNDFVVWGERESATGNKIVIRYHLAIDKKPETGNEYTVFFYKQNGVTVATIPVIVNSIAGLEGLEGVTYFIPSTQDIEVIDGEKRIYGTVYLCLNSTFKPISGATYVNIVETKDWRTELYYQGLSAQSLGNETNHYFAELSEEWPRIYDIRNNCFNEDYINDPSNIIYYLDFIDSDAAIGEFNVNNIGRRTKAINDNSINCLFEPAFPDLVILEKGIAANESIIKECDAQGQSWTQTESGIYNALVVGTSYNSAYGEIRNQLYQCSSYNESITVQAMPIYYLEPNTRITVIDPASGIGGDYIIKSISLPLTVNGTMSLSCTRALQRI